MKKILPAKITRQNLLLGLCVLGVAAAALWSASVGHMSSNNSLPAVQKTPAAYKAKGVNFSLASSQPGAMAGGLQAGANAQAGSGSGFQNTGNTTSGGSGSSSSTTQTIPPEPDPLYPIDPTPKCSPLYYPEGQNSMIMCPLCETNPTADGLRYPCGCYGGGGIKPEIMCPY